MTFQTLTLRLLAASLFLLPALGATAQDEEVNVEMGVGMGDMGMGLNMNVRVHDDDADLDDEDEEVEMNVRTGGAVRVRSSSSVTTRTTTVRTGPAPVATAVVVAEPAPTCHAMDSGTFSEVMSALEDESFSDGKLGVLGDAVEHSCVSVAQVVRVLGAFSFGADKLKALEEMAPQIANPQKKFKIYGAFDFDDDKKKAKRILASVH